MRPLDTPETSDPEPAIHVTSAALAALRSPLAVISGRSQLLGRQIRRSDALAAPDYLAVLALIERSVQELEGQLRALQDAAYRAPGRRA
jgi:signal transduction histidine kinase